jgi:ABC-type transport system involved in cytochrome c biogenesis permease subunit
MLNHNASLQQFQNLYLIMHVITICLSYIAFFTASVAAALYLIQDNFLKHKQTGTIFNRLPNLFFLDKLNYGAIGSGFPILTLSIISGFIWAKHVRGVVWSYDHREIYSIVLWFIYALILHVRLSAKLRGRKVAQLSLFAFCVIVFSLLGSCR